jgi:hypothetical protein
VGTFLSEGGASDAGDAADGEIEGGDCSATTVASTVATMLTATSAAGRGAGAPREIFFICDVFPLAVFLFVTLGLVVDARRWEVDVT